MEKQDIGYLRLAMDRIIVEDKIYFRDSCLIAIRVSMQILYLCKYADFDYNHIDGATLAIKENAL